MVEPGGQNEYELISPRERNMELKKLLNAFPTWNPAGSFESILGQIPGDLDLLLMEPPNDDEAQLDGGELLRKRLEDRIKRHNESEVKQRIFPKIDALLDISNTTQAFRTNFRKYLESLFSVGIRTMEEELDDDFEIYPDQWGDYPVRTLLGLNDPEREGIFGANSWVEERFLYSYVCYEIEEREIIREKQGREPMANKPELETVLKNWRDEYKAKYGKGMATLPYQWFTDNEYDDEYIMNKYDDLDDIPFEDSPADRVLRAANVISMIEQVIQNVAKDKAEDEGSSS